MPVKGFCVACNVAVMEECGRLPVYIDSKVRGLNYWMKLIEMPNTRYAKKCYAMIKYYNTIIKTIRLIM